MGDSPDKVVDGNFNNWWSGKTCNALIKRLAIMLSKLRRNLFIMFIVTVLCASQACSGGSLATLHLTDTPGPTLTSIDTLTPIPSGIFVLLFYPPLIISYDSSIWADKSNYRDRGENVNPSVDVTIDNHLQALNLETCQVGVAGPSGNFPIDAEHIQLGIVEYLFSLSETNTQGMTAALYIENQSIDGYDYKDGLPVLMIQASTSEWKECKTLGEKVLSALHLP